MLSVELLLAAGCSAPCRRAQALSAECCAELGADACGARLFCANFDGGVVNTCHENGSRRGGETCFASPQCVSGVCDFGNNSVFNLPDGGFESAGKARSPALCRNTLGEACTVDLGCALPGQNPLLSCIGGTCKHWRCGQSCSKPQDCADIPGECVGGKCSGALCR